MKVVRLEQLDAAYEIFGIRGERPSVILLHGFPDDATAWTKVGRYIAAEGRHALAPYTRGCGPSRFRSADVPRSGQVAARARDVVAFMNALQLESAVLVDRTGARRPPKL